jgi:hypothetical protein
MNHYELFNRFIQEHHAKSILCGFVSRLAKLLLILSPSIFLFSMKGGNFYMLLGIFFFVLVILWLVYVRATNYCNIHFYVYKRLTEDKDRELEANFI